MFLFLFLLWVVYLWIFIVNFYLWRFSVFILMRLGWLIVVLMLWILILLGFLHRRWHILCSLGHVLISFLRCRLLWLYVFLWLEIFFVEDFEIFHCGFHVTKERCDLLRDVLASLILILVLVGKLCAWILRPSGLGKFRLCHLIKMFSFGFDGTSIGCDSSHRYFYI